MRIAEHILLESDLLEVPDVGAARKVHARIAFCSRLRRRFMQLEIIDYYYLAVRSRSRSTRASRSDCSTKVIRLSSP